MAKPTIDKQCRQAAAVRQMVEILEDARACMSEEDQKKADENLRKIVEKIERRRAN